MNPGKYYDNPNEESGYVTIPLPLLVILAALGLIFALSRVQITAPEPAGAAAPPQGSIAPLFTPEVQRWAADIARWSQQTGLDANLIATVMQIESCGDPQARSGAGAMGLFQVMPYHFEGGENPYDPVTNASRGLDYLQRALTAREGVPRLGLAGYNGGISGAQRPEDQWAAETQRYVYWGEGIYADAQAGRESSARLEAWLNAGGASLCRQAAARLGLAP